MTIDISLIASFCAADYVHACHHADVIHSFISQDKQFTLRTTAIEKGRQYLIPALWESSFTALTCLLFSALSKSPKGVTAIAVSFYPHYLSHLCVTKSFQYHTQVIVVRLKHRHKYYTKHLIHEA